MTEYSYVTKLEQRIGDLEVKVQSLQKEPATVAPALWHVSHQSDQRGASPEQISEPSVRLDEGNVQDVSPEEYDNDGNAISDLAGALNFFGKPFFLGRAFANSHRAHIQRLSAQADRVCCQSNKPVLTIRIIARQWRSSRI